MTYADFIEELRRHVAEGEQMLGGGVTHESSEFVRWRHATRSLVDHARVVGHNLPGGSRFFRALRPGASARENAEAFRKDMDRSVTELRFVVEQYDKFGEPGKPAAEGHTRRGPPATRSTSRAAAWARCRPETMRRRITSRSMRPA